ncbi:MAG TPA: YerC/YecD family TrpR-related protein [Steroidobacteraceae bacterium]|jgi:TrpR-related protein YerC/YecD|nr:YerC/YecD family TrpR-related protein [Steroidobacteraceae bacterium]
MKPHKDYSSRQESQAEQRLAEALLTLRSVEECRAFLRDLCTPAELQAMADRWAVVRDLERGLPYRDIHDHTGVSVTTIGRVARYLAQGNGGYAIASRRLGVPARG